MALEILAAAVQSNVAAAQSDAAAAAAAAAAPRSAQTASKPALAELEEHTKDYQKALVSDTKRDWQLLCGKLEQSGYLFIRGLLPPKDVVAAHKKMLDHFNRGVRSELVIAADTGAIVDGSAEARSSHDRIGWQTVGQSAELKLVYESEKLQQLLHRLSSFTDAFETLPECTWLRAKMLGGDTQEHSDYLFFRNNMPSVFGDPFRPARATGSSQLCAQVMVSPAA